VRWRRTKRSVLFLNNNYYHFYYLAQALRRRGWDAVTVSVEDPEGPNAIYYHGEDVNLFSPDRREYRKKIERFFREATRRFDLLNVYDRLSFFPENAGSSEPWDIIEWRRRGRKIAYTVSGCKDAVAQSSVALWSTAGEAGPVCNKCVWQLRPDVCSDELNLTLGRKLDRYCDVIFTEGDRKSVV